MIRRAAIALLALPLASCQHVAQTNGDETISATSLFTNINIQSDCTQSDGDGNILSQTHHTLTTNGDTATLHEAGSIFGSALAFAGKFIPLPVPPLAARQPGRMGAVPSPSGSPAVTGCSGEKTVSTRPQPAPAPSPAPQPPPFKPAAFEPGWHQGVNPAGERTRRYLRAVDPGRATVAYYTVAGRRHVVSDGAWLAWAEGGA
jgi:hypothetical protein